MILVSKMQKFLVILFCIGSIEIQSSVIRRGGQKLTAAQQKNLLMAEKAVLENTAAFLAAIPKPPVKPGLQLATSEQMDTFNNEFASMVQSMPVTAIVPWISEQSLQTQKTTEQAVKKLFQDVYSVEAYLFNQNFFVRLANNFKNQLILVNENSVKLLENLTTADVPVDPITSIIPTDSQIRTFINYITFGQQMNLPATVLPEHKIYLAATELSFGMPENEVSSYENLLEIIKEDRDINLQFAQPIAQFFKKYGDKINVYAQDVLSSFLTSQKGALLVDILNGNEQSVQSVQDFVKSLDKNLKQAAYTLFTKKYVVGAFESVVTELVEFNQRANQVKSRDVSNISFDIPKDWISYLKFLLGLSAGVVAVVTVDEKIQSNVLAAKESAARDALQAAFELEFAKKQQAANVAAIQAALDQAALKQAETKKAKEENKSLEQVQQQQKEKSEAFEMPKLIQFDEKSCEEFVKYLMQLTILDLIPLKQIMARVTLWTAQAREVDYQQIVQELRAYVAVRTDEFSKKLYGQLKNMPTMQDLKAVDYARFIQVIQKYLAARSDLFIGSEYDSFTQLPELSMKNREAIAQEVQTYFVGVSQEFMKLSAQAAITAKLYAIDFKKSANEIIQNIHDQVKEQNPALSLQLHRLSIPQLGTPSSVDQLYLIGYCKQQAAMQHATGLIVQPGKGKGLLAKSKEIRQFAQVAIVVSNINSVYGSAPVLGKSLQWSMPTAQTKNYVDRILNEPKVLQQLQQEAAPVKMIQDKPAKGTISQIELSKIADLAAIMYQNLPEIQNYMSKAADAVEITEGLTPEIVVNNTIQLADGTTLPSLSTVAPEQYVQDVKTIIRTGIELLIAQDRGDRNTLELMPQVAQLAIEDVLPVTQQQQVVSPTVSQGFKADCKNYSIKLAQSIMNAGSVIVTAKDLQAALRRENITILNLSNPNDMAYLMGYVQVNIWMLQENPSQEINSAKNSSQANLWSVLEVVSFLR